MTDFVPGDVAVTCSSDKEHAPAVHSLYEWDGRAWRPHVALLQGAQVIVIATCAGLFEDGLPGCMVMTMGEDPVMGWMRMSALDR